tara:strand:+ start:20 stop:511 length:492 start_codon:yes stop_codon:yes gene_type:complete
MTKSELRDKIKLLVKTVYGEKKLVDITAEKYDELTKFPELKDVIVDLLGPQFDVFLASIDWVAPKPTTFRINLKNGENFYLVFNRRSWVAEIEGKKYYLLNLNEQENAETAIGRMLRYGAPDISGSQDAADFNTGNAGGNFPGEESGGGASDIEVDVDTETEA